MVGGEIREHAGYPWYHAMDRMSWEIETVANRGTIVGLSGTSGIRTNSNLSYGDLTPRSNILTRKTSWLGSMSWA
jgi:hypothetical protein